MQRIVFIVYKVFQQIILRINIKFYTVRAIIILYINNVKFGTLTALGTPIMKVSKGACLEFGNRLSIRSSGRFTDTGDNRPCKFIVSKNGHLVIGENVGLSATTIVCKDSITIGDNVKIGGGCTIIDTNFHPINYVERNDPATSNVGKTSPIIIGNNVFVGMSSIILKGVSIGQNSVIAAGSVVAKDIPMNEIWGGNPAKFIKKI